MIENNIEVDEDMMKVKSSQNAPLTPNQTKGFPDLEIGGGTVVGKGKGVFTGGYTIPAGTKVEIVRLAYEQYIIDNEVFAKSKIKEYVSIYYIERVE
ncbi:MAG: hypothetical protein PUC65_15480 [Clostridiales bacterium]|nr:hypothetical protein [Clostridiales bacterium]